MKFIEMTGRQLVEIIREDELHIRDLHAAGLADETIVRVNQHGDIEIRRPDGWDVVGGLLGNYDERIKRTTGLDWV